MKYKYFECHNAAVPKLQNYDPFNFQSKIDDPSCILLQNERPRVNPEHFLNRFNAFKVFEHQIWQFSAKYLFFLYTKYQ